MNIPKIESFSGLNYYQKILLPNLQNADESYKDPQELCTYSLVSKLWLDFIYSYAPWRSLD